jgi:4-hydroxy-tetrahydrodipicolinate reductase
MVNVVIVGAGPIGSWGATAAVEDGVVAGVTGVVDPDQQAREELMDSTDAPGYASTVELPPAREGDRALVAFSSRADKVSPEILRLVSLGYNVVTTCEELAWAPHHVWDAMHTSARSSGRVIIVTGANPGFAMDRFPLMLATSARNVSRVRVERRVDSSHRRSSLVEKTGYHITPEAFAAGIPTGEIGHKGLDASARLIARGLLWPYHDVSVDIEPVFEGNRIVGADHHAALNTGDGRTIDLFLTMAWGLDPIDRVEIVGEPPITVTIEGGFPGDEGTTANVVAAMRRCTELAPGFYRPTDLPLRLGVR